MAARDGVRYSVTSMSLPVATSKTKPRNDTCLVTKGLFSMRRSDCRTSASGSGNASAAHGGLTPGLVLDVALEVVVGEGEHSAVAVVDQDDLLRPQQALADGQRADDVVGDHPAGVADDVGFALVETEDAVNVEPGVHARDDRDVFARRQRQRPAEVARVLGVVGQVVIGNRHADGS